MRLLPLSLVLVLLAGCGYVASPLAPLVNIPARVSDLAAIERGGFIIVQFTVPRLTTEGVALEAPPALDLRIGPSEQPWNASQWEGRAKRIPESAASSSGKPLAPGAVAHYEVPAAEWIGQEVAAAALVVGANGKPSGWSNVVSLAVIPPLDRPSNLSGEPTSAGLRLTWQARGGHFRVLRASGAGEHYDLVATTALPEWTDPNIRFGAPYRYMVQTFVPQSDNREAQSELSQPYSITPEAPAPGAPTDLRAVGGPASVELSWAGSPEPDVTGYRIYRGPPNGTLERIGETGPIPSYSDRTAEHGHNYAYAVSAVNASGKESPQSPPTNIGFQ